MPDVLLLVDGTSHLLLTDGTDLLLASDTPAAPASTYPTVSVEFSPTTGPFDTPAWVDITARVLTAEWVDGKQADLNEYPPGQSTVVLENSDRLFDPEHAAGAYYGQLLPRVPFRIRAVHASVTYDLFYGFVEDGWRQVMEPPAVAACEVTLVDLLGVLHGYTLPSVMEASVLALDPVGYWPLNETAGARSAGDKVGTNDGTVADEVTFGSDPILPGLGTSASFDGVNDRIDISRSWLWPRSHLVWTVVAVIRTDVEAEPLSEHPVWMQVDGNNGADIDAIFVTSNGHLQRYRLRNTGGTVFEHPTYVADGEPHIIFAQAQVDSGIAIDSAVIDTTSVVGFLQSGNGVAIGGTPFAAKDYTDNQYEGLISHVAVWDRGLTLTERQGILAGYESLEGWSSGEQIGWALDQIGVPVGMRSLDVGAAVMGPAYTNGKDALTFMREVAATEQGDLYVAHHDGGKLRFRDRYASFQDTRSVTVQATFSDDPTVADTAACRVEPGSLEVEPNGVDSIINQATVTWVGGEETVDESGGSPYGPRPVTIRTQAPNPGTARGIGQWIVANNATPAAKIRSLTVHPGATPAHFTMTLATRVADRAAYRSHPQATGAATTKQLEVLGRRHRIEGVDWWATFYLTEHPDIGVDLFTLGTSTLGGTHILAY